MEPIIQVKNISKQYKIVHQRGGYISLRDVMANVARSPFAFLKHKARAAVGLNKKEEFWALKDVSFDVHKGEVIGVIGRNGAGKSTLLKILSQITEPTEGEIVMRGSVGSLLEVGTGFHPELSGRENIFLNGAILGMTRKEIAEKFDRIVEFSGVEKFIDTPVKRYSSGMYVRLAFSVAAHMEPDILLVDEVLAVGDTEFQKKCLGKMSEITAAEGRTIIFVSHNLSAISQLCKRCILLEKGRVSRIGATHEVIDYYLNRSGTMTAVREIAPEQSSHQQDAAMKRISILNSQGQPSASIPINTDFSIRLEYEVKQLIKGAAVSIIFYRNGEQLLLSDDFDMSGILTDRAPGHYVTTVHIPAFLFNVGEYMFETFIHSPQVSSYDLQHELHFEITDHDNPRSVIYGGLIRGSVASILKYETQRID